VPTKSLALFSEEEVARWSPVAPVAVAAASVAAAAAPSAAELAKRTGPELKEQLKKAELAKRLLDQAMYWHRRRWADNKPVGTQIVVVQQIFATPQVVDQSKLLVVQEGQYLYLLGCTADGWSQYQANELGTPKQVGFVPTKSLALFSEEEVARWSPAAPVAAAAAPVAAAAAAAPSAGELAKLEAQETGAERAAPKARLAVFRNQGRSRGAAAGGLGCRLLFLNTEQHSLEPTSSNRPSTHTAPGKGVLLCVRCPHWAFCPCRAHHCLSAAMKSCSSA
jgi:hypothetical protein